MTQNSQINRFTQNINQFRKNPFQFLLSKKMDIPSNLQNDPEGIVQYFMNTGRMTQEQLQQIQAFKGQVENILSSNTR